MCTGGPHSGLQLLGRLARALVNSSEATQLQGYMRKGILDRAQVIMLADLERKTGYYRSGQLTCVADGMYNVCSQLD